MLENVEWGEFKINDLFESSNGDFDIQKSHINNLGEYVITAGLTENGIMGKTNVKAKVFDKNTITIDMFGNVFFRQFKYKIVTHARVFSLKPKFSITEKQGLFLATLFHFLNKKFSYDNMCLWTKIKDEVIKIPVKNDNLDFDFMEEFITEIEKYKINKLNEHLYDCDLKDYHLSKEEENSINNLHKISWKKFKIEEVLEWQKNISEINPLDLDLLSISNKQKYPFYGQATINNGIIEYRDLEEKVLNNKLGKPTILIHSNNQNTVYLETPFYLKDGHGATSVLQSNNLNKKTAFFLMSSIKKVILEKYSYNAKATKIELKNTFIDLPVKEDNNPDYEYMSLVISALQKLVIKNLVLYVDNKIA
jgi:hypothetical protein